MARMWRPEVSCIYKVKRPASYVESIRCMLLQVISNFSWSCHSSEVWWVGHIFLYSSHLCSCILVDGVLESAHWSKHLILCLSHLAFAGDWETPLPLSFRKRKEAFLSTKSTAVAESSRVKCSSETTLYVYVCSKKTCEHEVQLESARRL